MSEFHKDSLIWSNLPSNIAIRDFTVNLHSIALFDRHAKPGNEEFLPHPIIRFPVYLHPQLYAIQNLWTWRHHPSWSKPRLTFNAFHPGNISFDSSYWFIRVEISPAMPNNSHPSWPRLHGKCCQLAQTACDLKKIPSNFHIPSEIDSQFSNCVDSLPLLQFHPRCLKVRFRLLLFLCLFILAKWRSHSHPVPFRLDQFLLRRRRVPCRKWMEFCFVLQQIATRHLSESPPPSRPEFVSVRFAPLNCA